VVDALNQITINDKLIGFISHDLGNPLMAVLPASPQPLLEGILTDRDALVRHEVWKPQTDYGADV
jgi:hypothetical protein